MLYVTLQVRGLKEMQTVLKTVIIDFSEEFKNLGDQTSNQMKKIIADNKVRPQAGEPTKLEDAITTEHFPNGWGVGSIEKLKQQAPGWRAVNYGSDHMVGKHLPKGVFDPGEPAPNAYFNRVGRWKKGEDYNGEQYSPIVTKPIPPMNYIERTVNWLKTSLTNLKRYGSKSAQNILGKKVFVSAWGTHVRFGKGKGM